MKAKEIYGPKLEIFTIYDDDEMNQSWANSDIFIVVELVKEIFGVCWKGKAEISIYIDINRLCWDSNRVSLLKFCYVVKHILDIFECKFKVSSSWVWSVGQMV